LKLIKTLIILVEIINILQLCNKNMYLILKHIDTFKNSNDG